MIIGLDVKFDEVAAVMDHFLQRDVQQTLPETSEAITG
jgi:hypothetical protein